MWGIDVGGANLKAAHVSGCAESLPFPLWRNPHGLAEALGQLVGQLPASRQAVLTMTGELADCFATKAEGVQAILSAAQDALRDCELRVYLVDGRLATVDEARHAPLLAAASNWHAVAALAARRHVPKGCGMLIDLGSTTADIVPLVDGGVAAAGRTDLERLACRELVYTGVERTPLFGLLSECRLRGTAYPTAPEWFATAADAYVLLGDVPEDPHNRHTADGRPLTRAAAHARIARVVCGDSTLITLEEARQIARDFRAAQQRALEAGIRAVAARRSAPPSVVAIGGQGEFLVLQVLRGLAWNCRIVSLSEAWGPAASRCAPAYALASLGTMADSW